MVDGIRGCQDFGFVNEVYPYSFKDLVNKVFSRLVPLTGLGSSERVTPYLAFNEVSYSGFCHHWNSYSLDDLFNHLGIRHSSYAALCSDVCWNPLKGHDSTRAGFFSYSRLLGIDDIHYDTALQHLGKTILYPETDGSGFFISYRAMAIDGCVIGHSSKGKSRSECVLCVTALLPRFVVSVIDTCILNLLYSMLS